MNAPHTEKQQVPKALIAPLLVMSALSFTVGMLLLSGSDYLSPGYTTITDRRISASGFQIWDLKDLFLLMLLGMLPAIGLLFMWQPVLKRQPGHGVAAGLCGLSVLLSVFFLPGPWEFQLRYYASPGQGLTLLRSYTPQGLVQMTRTEKFENFYDADKGISKTFLCHDTTRIRLGAMRIDTHFYPILDKENHLALLEERCQS